MFYYLVNFFLAYILLACHHCVKNISRLYHNHDERVVCDPPQEFDAE